MEKIIIESDENRCTVNIIGGGAELVLLLANVMIKDKVAANIFTQACILSTNAINQNKTQIDFSDIIMVDYGSIKDLERQALLN